MNNLLKVDKSIIMFDTVKTYIKKIFLSLLLTQQYVNRTKERIQENNVVWWAVVIVAVLSIITIMAACKALGGEYGGEFSVLGILTVKVKCKS